MEQLVVEAGYAAHRSATMLSGRQISAALGLLQISAAELAAQAGTSLSTVKRAENARDDVPNITSPNLARIEAALERLGVVFISEGAASPPSGVGVRLRRGNV
jgi:transcriptional regulator with XRE-family HTH domain